MLHQRHFAVSEYNVHLKIEYTWCKILKLDVVLVYKHFYVTIIERGFVTVQARKMLVNIFFDFLDYQEQETIRFRYSNHHFKFNTYIFRNKIAI